MSLSEQNLDPAEGGARAFRTTHWSVVLAARDAQSPRAHEALEKLCRAYWYPLYAYVRRQGQGAAEAQDLTQEFFSRLLADETLTRVDPARGKFRSFLLATMNHLMANEWDRAQAQKRGGGCTHFSLDAVAAEDRYQLEPLDVESPDKLFERRWAQTLLDRVVERVGAEWDLRHPAIRFDNLKVFLVGRKGDESFADAASRLSTTVPAVKSAVQKLRVRYREIFRQEIAETVSRPEEIEEEIRHLFDALK